MKKFLLFISLLFPAGLLFAELDPALEDLSVDKMNPDGLFLKGVAGIGQSDPAGDSTAGVGFLGGAELGYGFSSGYWKRMEVGIGLETGQLAYKVKYGSESAKVSVSVPMAMMMRFGLGSVVGSGGVLTYSLSVGSFLADYEQKYNGTTYKSNSASSSFAWRLGAQFLMPVNENFQFEGGIQHTQVTVSVDELKANGQKVNTNISDIINIPQLTVGFRVSVGGD